MSEVYTGSCHDALSGEGERGTGVYTSFERCLEALCALKEERDKDTDDANKRNPEWGVYPYEIFSITMHELDTEDSGVTVYQVQGETVLKDLQRD